MAVNSVQHGFLHNKCQNLMGWPIFLLRATMGDFLYLVYFPDTSILLPSVQIVLHICECVLDVIMYTGLIQGSLSKIQGLFNDFSRLFYSFQRLKV